MIIVCGSCNSRFRLDESKITGRGARVRCRKCGEAITVMKDDVDAAAGTAAAKAAEQEEGLDLRSILRETMDAPVTQGATGDKPAGADALQSEFEKMMADAGSESGRETAASPAADVPAAALGGDVLRGTGDADAAARAAGGATREQEAREPAQGGGQSVEFGPEEELTFQQPGGREPTPAEEQAPREPGGTERPGAAGGWSGSARETQEETAAAGSSSEFMMSTADSLDFLKADYDRGEQKAALDISGSLRIAPAPGAGEPKVAPPLGTQSAPPAAPPVEPASRSDAIRNELAGLGGAGAAAASTGMGRPAPAAPADRQAPREPGWREQPGEGGAGAAPAPARGGLAAPPPSAALRDIFAQKPFPAPAVLKAPARTAPPLTRGQGSQLVRPSVVLLLLLFFALAGGGAYLGFTSDGQKILRGFVPQVESLWLGGGKAASRYEVGSLIGYYETSAVAGKMFVIKGQVTNEGQLRRTGVRVHAALLDSRSQTVAERTVYAGNVMSGDALRKAGREKIEAAMSNPIGGGLANMDIPPGMSVPFMVVFFDAPDGIDSYRLEPKDVD